jgi:O-antigen ligase
MATPEAHRRAGPLLLLAGALLGAPWAAGGQSPLGQLLLLLAVSGGALIACLADREGPPPLPAAVLPAGILVALSALQSIYPDRTVQALLLLAVYLTAGVLAGRLARHDRAGAPLLLAAVALSGLGVTLGGMLAWWRGGDGGAYASVLIGPFGYPNAAAGFLLLAVGAALALAAGMPSGPLGWALVALAGFPLAGMLLTRSRGAVIALLVGALVWAAVAADRWWPRRRLWLRLAALAGPLAAAAAAPRWLPLLAAIRAAGLWESLDPSFQWRWHILDWGWQMVRDHPWLGVGPGAFPVALLSYQRLPYVSGMNPHNLALELAAEYGLPAAGILCLAFLGLLLRLAGALRRLPPSAAGRLRLELILATLAAVVAHASLDLLWSVPVIPTAAATLAGIAAGHLPASRRRRSASAAWRAACVLLLLALAGLGLGRYAAARSLAAGQAALAEGNAAAAGAALAWTLRLNPLSFAAHQGLTQALLSAGKTGEAVALAGAAARLAPRDPNGHYLAGTALLSAGQYAAATDRFLTALELAPATQLRFHASLVEALCRGGRLREARWRVAQALEIFSEARVTAMGARCLVPGDRYLLARMGRLAAQGAPESAPPVAARLGLPDDRGICTYQGSPDRRSPERAVVEFWRVLAAQGEAAADRFLLPRGRETAPSPARPGLGRLPLAAVVRIAALDGGERAVRLEYELEIAAGPLAGQRRCAQTPLRFTPAGWFLADLPRIAPEPCWP